MDRVRIGIVGINGYAQTHLRSIKACEEAGLAVLEAAVVRPGNIRDENFQALEQRGVRVYDSFDDMLEKEQGRLDLIALPTGIDSHATLSIGALEKGSHVMCEKPAAGTMEDVMAMGAAQKKSGKQLAIGFQNIFTPTVQRIKEIRLNRTLGELLEARTKVSWPRDARYYHRNSWAGKLSMGGKPVLDSPLQNAAAHYLQNMLYIAGSGRDSSALPLTIYGENYHVQPIQSADTQYIRIKTEEGPLIQMSATHACREKEDPVTDFFFERGRIRWESDFCEIYHCEGEGEILVERVDIGKADVHQGIFLDVCRSLLAGETPLCTIENSWQQVLCVNRLFEAAPVIEVSSAYYNVEGQGEEENYYLPGIIGLQDEMFLTGQSFYEAGAPWAVPGGTVKGDW
ncbi:MAG: Gfo/Idh/MocA family oxidoreductase [Spirochaetales bacterium]|nr:Gfo/Idh/MocA family oxidoreductase [Spirochaetales bacterium]